MALMTLGVVAGVAISGVVYLATRGSSRPAEPTVPLASTDHAAPATAAPTPEPVPSPSVTVTPPAEPTAAPTLSASAPLAVPNPRPSKPPAPAGAATKKDPWSKY
jgi:hypothetical protein